jgi:hypothetical protein
MVKKVKLPEDSMILGRDEIVDYDELSLDGVSQGEDTKGSEDASDYEDDPQGAPGRLHFGSDRCLKLFQLSKDVQDGTVRVCGGSSDCNRKGHKKTTERGLPGVYDTIKTLHYVDGIQSTHRTLEVEQQREAEQKAILLSLTGRLTDSTAYKASLKAVASELDIEGDEGTEGDKAWDDCIDEAELKMPASNKPKAKIKAAPTPTRSGSTMARQKARITGQVPSGHGSSPTEDPMVTLVKEVKEALNGVTASMVDLSRATRENNRKGSPSPAKRMEEDDEDDDLSDSGSEAYKKPA